MASEISQSDAVYSRLRADILSMTRAPGERISERGLEDAYRASRTPVRSALSRLGSEGLVRRDGRAWIVAPLDLAEVVHAAELREALETAAIAVAVERATDEQLVALATLAAQPWRDTDDSLRHGDEFHVELAALAGNPLLSDALRGAMLRLARARWLEASTPAGRQQHRDEHEAIAAALRDRDAPAATRLAHEHGRRVRDHLLDSLAGDRARGLRVTGSATNPIPQVLPPRR